MSVKPILFNGMMVRAILDGRKTVTRRVLRGEAQQVASDYVRRYSEDLDTSELIVHWWVDTPLERYALYRPGDVLWVRETWAHVKFGRGEWHYEYRANCEHPKKWSNGSFAEWNPSIHMPREAARIWLRVTDVRVERLQEVCNIDMESEGISVCLPLNLQKKQFGALWDSTIKPADREKYGWDASPWVWVIAFERCEKPEEDAT